MVKYLVYELKSGELLGHGPRKERIRSIFVAYNFSIPESINFRMKIEQEIKRCLSLSDVRILDGHVAIGKKWATVIRYRLKVSDIVVADYSVLNPEVLFECGFAWGLGKPILPVTRSKNQYYRLPRWITELQIGNISSENGWKDLIDSINLHFNDKKRDEKSIKISPKPGRIILINIDAESNIAKRIRYIEDRYDMEIHQDNMSVESIENADDDVIKEINNASLILAPLNGTTSDHYMHFATGAVVSHPSAGVSSKRLLRKILLICEDKDKIAKYAADSARRVRFTVKVISIDELDSELEKYAKLYRNWIVRQG